MSFIQWCCERGAKSHRNCEDEEEAKTKKAIKELEVFVSQTFYSFFLFISFFQLLYFIIFFCTFFTHDINPHPHPHPRPTTHTHDPRPTTHDPRPTTFRYTCKRYSALSVRMRLFKLEWNMKSSSNGSAVCWNIWDCVRYFLQLPL